jgi:hypothetical protein
MAISIANELKKVLQTGGTALPVCDFSVLPFSFFLRIEQLGKAAWIKR